MSVLSIVTAHYQNSEKATRRHLRRGMQATLFTWALVGLAAVIGPTKPAGAAPAPGDQVPLSAPTGSPPDLSVSPPDLSRQALQAAYDAVTHKQWNTLQSVVPQAARDPLGVYAQYWLLSSELGSLPSAMWPAAELNRFLDTSSDAYLADRLRGQWIVASAMAGDYNGVKRLGAVLVSNPQIRCAQIEASIMSGAKVPVQEAMDAFAPGAVCWNLYDQLVSNQTLSWAQLQPSLRGAIEADKLGDARRYGEYLFNSEQQRDLDALLRNPMKWLVLRKRPVDDRGDRELVTIALARLARGDQQVGADYIAAHWVGVLPRADLRWVYSQFALVTALNLQPEAADWYEKAGDAPLTQFNLEWKVRTELRAQRINWRKVVDTIDTMAPDGRSISAWVYWRSRGLAAEGKTEEARKGYLTIADSFTFYGQLAEQALGRDITMPPPPPPVSPQAVAEIGKVRGLQRALDLFQLGWRNWAVPEWNFALRGMTDDQLRAAAALAWQAGVYDRVVNTSEMTDSVVDVSQRYIAPYEQQMAGQAKNVSLDVAWIYGLIRQESRFILEARSHVGASGLMQIMPSTARWVARKLGLSNFTPDQLAQFDTNTVLGTNYLSMVLQKLDGSQVLATAGYNAGPGRPVNWRASLSHPVEGAIFAETIPFTETRLYVKNVMANATCYEAIFTGKPQSLIARLGVISPEPAVSVGLP